MSTITVVTHRVAKANVIGAQEILFCFYVPTSVDNDTSLASLFHDEMKIFFLSQNTFYYGRNGVCVFFYGDKE